MWDESGFWPVTRRRTQCRGTTWLCRNGAGGVQRRADLLCV